MTRAYLYRTFEFVDPARNDANIEVRITFNYSPGRTARHPTKDDLWTLEPSEREYIRAERETTPNKWVPIIDREWLHGWCIAALEAADEDDLVRALPDREDAPCK